MFELDDTTDRPGDFPLYNVHIWCRIDEYSQLDKVPFTYINVVHHMLGDTHEISKEKKERMSKSMDEVSLGLVIHARDRRCEESVVESDWAEYDVNVGVIMLWISVSAGMPESTHTFTQSSWPQQCLHYLLLSLNFLLLPEYTGTL